MELSPLWDRRSGIWDDPDEAGCTYRYDFPGKPCYCGDEVEPGEKLCADHGGRGHWD
jgi:hypothetical protein